MAHDHAQAQSAAAGRPGARHQRRLAAALGLTVGFLVVQVVTGIVTGSLALLSDAGHMATDALGLSMALIAIHLASRGARDAQQTFGLYRLEILAALANAVLLFGVAGYVLVEAGRRLSDPPEIAAGVVLVVGVIGLAVNLASFALLRPGADESLNVHGAYLEVLADLLGSIGVVVAAIVMSLTDWLWVDPVIGAAIGVFILPRAWRLGREALRILVQAAPASTDLAAIDAELRAIPGVVDVHDLHVWTLTSEMEVATAHVMVESGADAHAVLDRARSLLSERHHLDHATLQVEPDDHQGCNEVSW
jgi:cobalt-zinc-cadmium efflux system protein